jgi:DNA-directed RNA polymerase
MIAERLSKDDLLPTLHPRHLPMLTKPKPWIDNDIGGYLYNKTYVMRLKDTQEQGSYLNQASKMGSLELIYAGLDVLGSTPWRINRDIFDTVLKVWNSGERFGKIPPSAYDVGQPEKPVEAESDPKWKVAWMTRMRKWQLDKAGCHSLRCSVNYRLEIARAVSLPGA